YGTHSSRSSCPSSARTTIFLPPSVMDGSSRTGVKSLAHPSCRRDSTKTDMRPEGLGPAKGRLDDVKRQLRVRTAPSPRSSLDVAAHEHPPGPSVHPGSD